MSFSLTLSILFPGISNVVTWALVAILDHGGERAFTRDGGAEIWKT